MGKKEGSRKFLRFLRLAYIKLFRINDAPGKIALGLGLGVFSGIMPGMGPLAALALAFLLRSNRASALLGSLFTNTWLSFLTFFLAVKTGSFLLGIKWQVVYQNWLSFIREFEWTGLFKLSILKIILPVMLGYLTVAFLLGLAAYLAAFGLITVVKHRAYQKRRIDKCK